jgi:hypothetical protein
MALIQGVVIANATTGNTARTTVSYLPSNSPVTVLPLPQGLDLTFAINRIEEKWARFFPLLTYYPLRIRETVVTDINQPAGGGEGTRYDPLTLELVEQATSPVHQLGAPVRKVFFDPVQINIALSREARDDELKLYGFDKVRDVIARVPLSLLDKAGIRVKQGDEFVWGDERFEVVDTNKAGYWKNTTTRLYSVSNCQTVRSGS